MKNRKARAIALAVAASAMTFSTSGAAAAAAESCGLYRPACEYCKKLEDNWTGSAEDWLNWIVMCS